MAISLCLFIRIHGFAQEQSSQVQMQIERLQSPNPKVRSNAADLLGSMGGKAKSAVPVLIAALTDKNSDVRSHVAHSLGNIGAGAKAAVPALLKALTDNVVQVRTAASWALGQMRAEAKDAVPGLTAALDDKYSSVSSNAAQALGKIGAEAKDAVPALILAVQFAEYADDRRDAAWALGRMGAEAKSAVPALIAALRDDDSEVRSNAATALGGIRTEAAGAIPGLIAVLEDNYSEVRSEAAWAIGRMGAKAADAVPSLIGVLKYDANSEARSNAAAALGEIESDKAKAAVPSLAAALTDNVSDVRSSAALSLGEIGHGAKEAVPSLIAVLKDEVRDVRINATWALGQMGAEATSAIPALIAALHDDVSDVRNDAADALAIISKELFDADNIGMLPQLKEAYDSLKNHYQGNSQERASTIKMAIDHLESLWWIGLRQKVALWILNHTFISCVFIIYLLLLISWSLLFWLHPLGLLPVSAFLGRYEPKIKTQNMEIGLPLRHLLLVSLFHYRKRVLDRWVQKHLVTARENFANRQTVKERKTYVSTPTMTNGEVFDSLSPALLQPIFDKPKATLLITGEGGAGKTSLACQMALWATDDEPENRPCKSYQMLPVLLEGNLDPQADGKNVFTETIRGHLRELIGMPDEIPEEFLLQLLRKRRALVIVDSLSELDEWTRHIVRPAQPDFPVAALIVTSRIDDVLSGAAKTIIKPLRLNKDRLSFFMDRYLEQRGKQFQTDEELFESCRNLSQLIGERDITALIAKMYAELKIASKEQSSDFDLPRNLPDLMQGYAVNINESVKADRKETRVVLDAAKAVAWECLRKSCRPAPAKRDDVLKALRREADAEALVEYLEERLQLIQTTGAAKDAIRFSLDPLAEYLASLHLVEHCNNSVSRWQEITDLLRAQSGTPELIKGFLLALEDCCKHRGQEHGVPGSAIEAINQLLKPAPAVVASTD